MEQSLLEQFKLYVLTGDFVKTLPLLDRIRWGKIEELLVDLGAYHSNIVGYSYSWFLLKEHENVERSRLGWVLMYVPFVYLEGSEELLHYYERRCIALNAQTLRGPEIYTYYKEVIIRSIKEEYREEVLEKILQADPDTMEAPREYLDNLIEQSLADLPDEARQDKVLEEIPCKNKFKDYLLAADFIKTLSFSDELSYEEMERVLVEIAQEENNIIPYAYTCFLIMHEESVKLHLLAARFINKISYVDKPLPGAYVGGYYHTRRALELDPTNIAIKASLLFYNTLPEPLLSDAEAHRLAQEVIQSDPSNEIAIQVLMKDKK